jgi:hypothetical protein
MNISPFLKMPHSRTLLNQSRSGHTYLVRDSEGHEYVSSTVAQNIHKALKEQKIIIYPDAIPHSSKTLGTQAVLILESAKEVGTLDKLPSMFPERLIFTGADAVAREAIADGILSGEKPNTIDAQANLTEHELGRLRAHFQSGINGLDLFDGRCIADTDNHTSILINHNGTLLVNSGKNDPYTSFFQDETKIWLDPKQELQKQKSRLDKLQLKDMDEAVKKTLVALKKEAIQNWEKLIEIRFK